jgi:hypothetical protein
MGEQPKVVNLGWENGWSVTPQIVKDCKAWGHQLHERNLDPSMQRCCPRPDGLNHEVRCDICGYVYHYDSSD